MNIEELREFCLNLPSVSEECPFGPETLVFKVKNKLFALCSIENFRSINLKCEPEKAIQLREEYSQIKPGFHMNKKHWNTIEVEGLSDSFLKSLVEDSYKLVVSGLPKKLREELSLGY